MAYGPVALAAYVLYRAMAVPMLAYHYLKQKAWQNPLWRP